MIDLFSGEPIYGYVANTFVDIPCGSPDFGQGVWYKMVQAPAQAPASNPFSIPTITPPVPVKAPPIPVPVPLLIPPFSTIDPIWPQTPIQVPTTKAPTKSPTKSPMV
jgi:hypothetical protein